MMAGPPVVLDSGTGMCKTGFAGDQQPRLVFPCVVGRPSLGSGQAQAAGEGPFIGYDALEPLPSQAALNVSYPVSNGIVQNWDEMRLIWCHAWARMGLCSPAESRIMLTDPVLNPVSNKQRMVEVMLEEYGFAGVGMQAQAVLTLYAHGLDTGVVLDAGDGVSHAVAVVDGYILPHLSQRLEVAGRHVTQHLMELLIRRGAALHRTADLHWVRRIKEAACYVAVDYDRELQLARDTTCLTTSYTLPDGRVIKVGAERFQAPEALFNPHLLDLDRPGISDMLFTAINDCDMDCRRRLYEHIVISGGTTMFPGLPTRLEADIRRLYLKHVLQGDTARLGAAKIRVHDSAERQHMVFRGAAILAHLLQDREDYWIGSQEWAEDPHRALTRLGVISAA